MYLPLMFVEPANIVNECCLPREGNSGKINAREFYFSRRFRRLRSLSSPRSSTLACETRTLCRATAQFSPRDPFSRESYPTFTTWWKPVNVQILRLVARSSYPRLRYISSFLIVRSVFVFLLSSSAITLRTNIHTCLRLFVNLLCDFVQLIVRVHEDCLFFCKFVEICLQVFPYVSFVGSLFPRVFCYPLS